MNIKSVFRILCIVALVAMMANQSEAHLKLKLALGKSKLAALAAPHVAAHVAVASDVKAKSLDAFWKAVASIKATKLAAASIITAPVRVVAKKIALKVAALKLAKALKVAKVASVVDTLRRNPIIVPIPVPVKVPFPVLEQNATKTTIAASLSPSVNSLLSGAQNLLRGKGQSLSQFLPSSSATAAVPLPRLTATATAAVVPPVVDQLTGPIGFRFPIVVPALRQATEALEGHQIYGVPSQ